MEPAKDIEIERKFLVDPESFKIASGGTASRSYLTQGYLSRDPCTRLRIVADENGIPREAWFTVKGPGVFERAEYDLRIHDDGLTRAIRTVHNMCPAKVTKWRHTVSDEDGVTWTVDEFTKRHVGLWLAEVELLSRDQSVRLPSWVGREVTEDPRYSNMELAFSDGPPT